MLRIMVLCLLLGLGKVTRQFRNWAEGMVGDLCTNAIERVAVLTESNI
jgi:hypothetical protein